MLEPSVRTESNFVCLDEFCKNPILNAGQVILFDNDEDFLAFCVDPVAVIDMDKDGNPYAYHGQFTEMYRKCLDAGMKFGIREEDSFVNKNKVADTRVLVPEGFNQLRKAANVKMPVQGIEELEYGYYLCEGKVYSRRSVAAKLVYELVYTQGKSPDDVRTILGRYCEILTEEQFAALDQEGKDSYKVFSIKRVKYPYKGLSGKKILALAEENGIHIEDLVIHKSSKR